MGHSGFKFHPLFVPFPIALLLGALAADLAFWGMQDPLCAEAASWLVTAALAACGISLVAGLLDGGWSHVFATAAGLFVLVIDAMMRVGVEPAATIPAGPVLNAFAAAILLAAGATAAERAAMNRATWRAAIEQGARSLHLHHAGR